ncbi:hypothetical protein QEN19_003033 [Hanseniaspora menglaensis]
MNFSSRTSGDSAHQTPTSLFRSVSSSNQQLQHATHSINENDQHLDNHILLISGHEHDNRHTNEQRSKNVTASVIDRIIENNNNLDDSRSISKDTNLKSYYNNVTSNIPESRYTVKKWFAVHPERQTELIKMFIDQLTWTNHLNFTEALKMLRSNFDFPFSGPRVLKRQYNSIISNLEKKVNDHVQLDEFDCLVMRLRDKKKECDKERYGSLLKKKEKSETYDELRSKDDSEESNASNTEYQNDQEEITSHTERSVLLRLDESVAQQKLKSQKPIVDLNMQSESSFSQTILKNIQEQIQSTFPNSLSPNSLRARTDEATEVKSLKEKIKSLEFALAELKHINSGYQAIIDEKNEYIRKKDESYMKVVDSLLKLQHEYQTTIKEIFSKI